MESVDLVNAALRDIGAAAITTISDTTPVGKIAGDVYEIKRDVLLLAHPWNFAIARARLGKLTVVSTQLVPAFEWDYAYSLPSDWLRTISVHDNESGAGAVPYKMESISIGEQLTNGGFDADATWTKGSGWTIADGVATHSASTGALSQLVTMPANAVYRISWTVSGWVSGAIQPQLSGGTAVNGPTFTGNGFFAHELTAHSGGNTTFAFQAPSTFVGSIDDVSMQRIDGEFSQSVIASDAPDLWLRYVRRVVSVDRMTYGFRQALIYLLGKVFAAGPAASNTLREISNEDLKQALRIAKSIDGMEDFPEFLPHGSWVTSRGSGNLWTRGSIWPAG